VADEDPPGGEETPFYIRNLDDLLGLLSQLNKTVVCPICTRNQGWIFPPGLERMILPTSKGGSIEAIPSICNVCGYMRLHVVNAQRGEP
jgi:hypothetical protein